MSLHVLPNGAELSVIDGGDDHELDPETCDHADWDLVWDGAHNPVEVECRDCSTTWPVGSPQ